MPSNFQQNKAHREQELVAEIISNESTKIPFRYKLKLRNKGFREGNECVHFYKYSMSSLVWEKIKSNTCDSNPLFSTTSEQIPIIKEIPYKNIVDIQMDYTWEKGRCLPQEEHKYRIISKITIYYLDTEMGKDLKANHHIHIQSMKNKEYESLLDSEKIKTLDLWANIYGIENLITAISKTEPFITISNKRVKELILLEKQLFECMTSFYGEDTNKLHNLVPELQNDNKKLQDEYMASEYIRDIIRSRYPKYKKEY